MLFRSQYHGRMGRRNIRVRLIDQSHLGLDPLLAAPASLSYVRLLPEKSQSVFSGTNIAVPDASSALPDALVHIDSVTALFLMHTCTTE